MDMTLEEIREAAKVAMTELLAVANVEEGDIIVVGCSTSEVMGRKVGTYSSLDVGKALVETLYPMVTERGAFLAAQCCEHLNRSLIIEKEAVKRWNLDRVNCKPQLHAGGAFALTLWNTLKEPCAVSHISAVAGMDIGGVLIGMHLKEVAVPVRASVDMIGKARLTIARTRPKFVGGERALYDDNLR